jgi:thioredoxin-related protein
MSITVFYIFIIGAILYVLTQTNILGSSDVSYLNKKITSDNKITIYWFYRPGCHYCDSMASDWNKLTKSKLPHKYKLVSVDTSLDKNKKLAEEYGVDGVPHIIKSLSNGHRKVYTGDRSMSDMKKWILSD